MRKLYSILAGILLFVMVLVGFKIHLDRRITENQIGVRDLRTYERFWSSEAQKLVIGEKTLPIFGSSELVGLSDYEDGVGNFLNGDQMNVITIGAGNFQTLYHTMAVSALADAIDSKKVALFLSPQWFTESGYGSAECASTLSENELLCFLGNKRVSKENKQYVLGRLETLLRSSPTQLARVRKYQKALQNPISVDAIYTSIMRFYWNYRGEYEVYKQLDKVNNQVPTYDLETLDFGALLELAQSQGESRCTNNEFGIYDDYWNTYVVETYEEGEVVEKSQHYTRSPEYNDLICFLDVTKELGIEVILVSIPVNGKWYEFQGILCDEYYQNIRDIAAEYSHVVLADMSVYEDEPYFLKDKMHLGWKGWARINEILYTEFVEK